MSYSNETDAVDIRSKVDVSRLLKSSPVVRKSDFRALTEYSIICLFILVNTAMAMVTRIVN